MVFWRHFKLSHTASSVDILSTSTRKPSCPPLRVITVIAWFNLLVIVALVVRTSANIRASGLISGHKINEQTLCWRNIYLHLCKKAKKEPVTPYHLHVGNKWHHKQRKLSAGCQFFLMLLIKACQKTDAVFAKAVLKSVFSQTKPTSRAYRFGVGTFAPKIMEYRVQSPWFHSMVPTSNVLGCNENNLVY